MMQGLGVTIPLSDDAGQIKLPPLPIGDLITRMTVDHPNFAAARVDDLTVAKGARAHVVLRPGITLTLRRRQESGGPHFNGRHRSPA